MTGHPTAPDLIDSVRAFLVEIESHLSDREAFHAKVAGNVLGIIERELRQQPATVEATALGGFLGRAAPLDVMRAELCAGLRSGRIDAATPGLLDALTVATVARLAVDNPKFPTLARLTETPT